MKRALTAAIACATLFALSACGSDGASDSSGSQTTDSASVTNPDDQSDLTELSAMLAGRTFLSSNVDGYTLVEGTQIRLSFERDAFSASAGCNQLGGSMSIDGDALVVGDMMQTEMGCEQALMEQDAWIVSLLQSRPTLSLDGDTLTMTSADATVVLVDREIADPDLPLVGTAWVVDGLISGDAVSSVPQNAEASMTIADGAATVDTGCNTGAASVEITDDTITFAAMPITEIGCEPEVMRLEGAVMSVLRGDVSYTVEAGRLTLLAEDDNGAVIGLMMTGR